MRFYWMLGFVAVTAGAVWGLYHSFDKKIHPDAKPQTFPPGQTADIRNAPPDPYQYFKDRAPRLVGMAFSAPVYDTVTKPITAPVPVACVSSATRCVCNSQQATRLDMDEKTCRSIVANGYFVDWREDQASKEKPAVAGRAKPDEPPPVVTQSAREETMPRTTPGATATATAVRQAQAS